MEEEARLLDEEKEEADRALDGGVLLLPFGFHDGDMIPDTAVVCVEESTSTSPLEPSWKGTPPAPVWSVG